MEEEKISRRDFFKKSFTLGAAAAGAVLFSRVKPVFAQNRKPTILPYDLVAVMGGEPEYMFDRGILELGGMKNFVSRGSTVAVKPNMSWYAAPEEAANTNPGLVKRVIEHCFQAGARRVYVFDNILGYNTYEQSGIEYAAKEAGARVVPGNSERYYGKVSVRGAVRLSRIQVHEVLLEADTLINIPVLKHHSSTHLTIGMKNLMGCVWDRQYYHRNGLHQCIADFLCYRKPDLTIIDAYRVMKNGGPSGRGNAEVMLKKMQILSPDVVAADAAAAAQAAMWGVWGADNVKYIRLADEMGLGTAGLSSLRIRKITL